MNARAPRFPLFDSLRGIAVLAVIAVHAIGIYAGGAAPSSVALPYLERLDVAATVFFLVSGFLLYRPFAAAHLAGTAPPRTAAYAWRRVLRIVPGYWVALTVTALVLNLPGVLSGAGLLTYYGFGQIYRARTMGGGIPQAWTLCVEIAFYAFVPLWAALAGRLRAGSPAQRARRELGALGLLAVGSLAYKLVVLGSGAVGARVPALTPWLTALPGYLDQIALGMALAVLSAWWRPGLALPRGLHTLDRFPGLAWGVALVLFVFAAKGSGLADHSAAGFTHAQYLERHGLNALIALALLLPAVFGDQRRGLVRRFLAHRSLLWTGLVSYGFYLYHTLVLAKLGDWGYAAVRLVHPYVSWYAACLAATALLAAVSYYALERPLLRLKSRVAGGTALEVSRASDEAGKTAEPGTFAPPPTTRTG